MYRHIGIILSLFYCTQVYSSSREKATNLLRCLAKEEQNIHENNHGGPLYKLNQKIINQVVLLNSIQLKATWIMKICHTQSSPTLVLMEGFLTEGPQIFELPEPSALSEYAITMATLKHFDRVIRQLTLDHLATIQSQMPTANCLEGEIPSLSAMYEDYRYIRKYLTKDKLLGPKRAKKIFSHIRDVDRLEKKCKKKKKKITKL